MELGQVYDPPIRCDGCCVAESASAAAHRYYEGRITALEAEVSRLRSQFDEPSEEEEERRLVSMALDAVETRDPGVSSVQAAARAILADLRQRAGVGDE
jgi:hypothetical protein